MALLLVSATYMVPSGPSHRPPGSDSFALPPAPSAKPAEPVPATVLMLFETGSSTCDDQATVITYQDIVNCIQSAQ